MANEFIARNGLIAQENSIITGSLTVTGGVVGNLNGTASNATSASQAQNANTATSASYALNATNALTASYFVTSSVTSASFAQIATSASQATNSNTAISASFATNAATATTASYVLNAISASFAATASFADNFAVRSTLNAATIVAPAISSSGFYSSGSNNFGNNLTQTQRFTGSFQVTGSSTFSGRLNVIDDIYISSSFGDLVFLSNGLASVDFTGNGSFLDYIQKSISAKTFTFYGLESSLNFETNRGFRIRNGSLASNTQMLITGSTIQFTGSVLSTGGFTGSLQGNATSATTATTATSASFAATSSYADNFTVRNTLTAQTLVVTTVSSSVVYSSGSNVFGNNLANTQQFTGSVTITGSLAVDGNQLITGIATIGSSSLGASENTLTLGARDNGSEGGQLGLNAPGGTYTSASMIDNYANSFRVLTGTNASSNRMDLELSHVTQNLRIFGDVIAYAASDKRLKENIQPIENALDKLDKIGGYTFDWNDKVEIHGHEGHDIGVIAQEIEEVLPEAVTTRDNGYKAVKYEKLTAFLIQVNKEQQKIIKDQQCQIDELRELINIYIKTQ